MTTDLEVRMTIKTLARKGVPKRAIARDLGRTEGNVRYHLRRIETGAVDGHSRHQHKAAALAGLIDFWPQDWQRCEASINLAELHYWLVADHDYGGGQCVIQSYVAAHYLPTRQRARRRIETPLGAQAQIDWGTGPNMIIAGQPLTPSSKNAHGNAFALAELNLTQAAGALIRKNAGPLLRRPADTLAFCVAHTVCSCVEGSAAD